MENQRVRLTKKLLKNALISLMETKPLDKITIKEICEKAETNRSTYYLHYYDQAELLADIENDILTQIKSYFSDISSELSTLEYIKLFLYFIIENKTIFKILLCREDSLVIQKKFIQGFLLNFKKNITFNCSLEISDAIYQFLVMGCLGIITQWIETGFNTPVDQIAELIFNLSDSAICPYL